MLLKINLDISPPLNPEFEIHLSSLTRGLNWPKYGNQAMRNLRRLVRWLFKLFKSLNKANLIGMFIVLRKAEPRKSREP